MTHDGHPALVVCASSRATRARLPEIQALHSRIVLVAPHDRDAFALREHDAHVPWRAEEKFTRARLRAMIPEIAGRRWHRVHVVAPTESWTGCIRLLLAARMLASETGHWHWGPWASPRVISAGAPFLAWFRRRTSRWKYALIRTVERGLRRHAVRRFPPSAPCA